MRRAALEPGGERRPRGGVVIVPGGGLVRHLRRDCCAPNRLGAGIIAAYALSRGFAQAGSREGPFMVDISDNDR